jgi:putative oxidoreductase
MSIGLFVLRFVVGGLFVGHGTQKLFGWFGGHGPEGTGRFFSQIGYAPGRPMAYLAGMSEAGSGALLVLGFLTPLACAGIVGVMVGTLAVHLPKGLWNTNGGYELPLVYSAAAVALAYTGPGRISVDSALGWSTSGVAVGTAAALLGVIAGGVMLAIRAGRVQQVQEEQKQQGRAA